MTKQKETTVKETECREKVKKVFSTMARLGQARREAMNTNMTGISLSKEEWEAIKAAHTPQDVNLRVLRGKQ